MVFHVPYHGAEDYYCWGYLTCHKRVIDPSCILVSEYLVVRKLKRQDFNIKRHRESLVLISFSNIQVNLIIDRNGRTSSKKYNH
jgi:hypothetical protein